MQYDLLVPTCRALVLSCDALVPSCCALVPTCRALVPLCRALVHSCDALVHLYGTNVHPCSRKVPTHHANVTTNGKEFYFLSAEKILQYLFEPPWYLKILQYVWELHWSCSITFIFRALLSLFVLNMRNMFRYEYSILFKKLVIIF